MPELPEVQTTVDGVNKRLKGLSILDVWTGYGSAFHKGKGNIKDSAYFAYFKKETMGAKVVGARRAGKNVLIDLSNGNVVLIHMKMTGHLMYGKYERTGKKSKFAGEEWQPHPGESEALKDPFNRFIRLVFTLSDGKHLAFSDMRKFAKVFVHPTSTLHTLSDIAKLGPDPLSKDFTYAVFKERILKRPKAPIKSVLMDQTLIAGIGNIYSDEILYEASVHPLSLPGKIPETFLKKMYAATKPLLLRGIDFGGDSTSDYRNIDGERGKFQHAHKVYRETGEPCPKKGCGGVIKRIKVGGRSAHFCPKHQVRY